MQPPKPNPAAYRSESAIVAASKIVGEIAERFHQVFQPVSMAVKKTGTLGLWSSYEIPTTVYSPAVWNDFVTRTRPFFEYAGTLLNRPQFANEAFAVAGKIVEHGFFPSIRRPQSWNLAALGVTPTQRPHVYAQLSAAFDRFSVASTTRTAFGTIRKALVDEQQRVDRLINTLNTMGDWISKVSNTGLSMLLSVATFGISDLVFLHRATRERLEKLFQQQQEFFDKLDRAYDALPTDAEKAKFLEQYRPILGTPATRALLELSKSTIMELFSVPPFRSKVAERLAPPLSLVDAMTAPETEKVLEKQRSVVSAFLTGIMDAYGKQVQNLNPFTSSFSVNGLGNEVHEALERRAEENERAAQQLPWWSKAIMGATLALTLLPRGPSKAFLLNKAKNPRALAFGFPLLICILTAATAAGLVAVYLSEHAVARVDASIHRALEEERYRKWLQRIALFGVFIFAAYAAYRLWKPSVKQR